MPNSYASVWDLPTFCRFYGKAIPSNEKNDEFTQFYTYSRNDDIKELYVDFNEEMNPLAYIQLVAMASNLYVIGHGEAWSEWGRTYYPKYTLFTKKQIENMYDHSIHFRYGDSLEGLFSYGQAQIFNKEDYLKNIPIAEKQEDDEEVKDLPFDEPSSPDLPF